MACDRYKKAVRIIKEYKSPKGMSFTDNTEMERGRVQGSSNKALFMRMEYIQINLNMNPAVQTRNVDTDLSWSLIKDQYDSGCGEKIITISVFSIH